MIEEESYEIRREKTLHLMKRLNEYVNNGGTLDIRTYPHGRGWLMFKPMYDTTSKPINENKKKRYHVSVDQ